MVQRTSQAVSFTQGTPQDQITQSSIGYLRPNAQAEYTTKVDDGTSRTLDALLKGAGQVMQQGIKNEQEEAYLAGAAKVGQIESEAELQANPMFRDWATAGYRDTMGRFKAADSMAQMQLDMATLRQQGPEAMQEYLAKQRADLTPSFEGMSREQRQANYGQLIVSQQAAIRLHAAEHKRFIIETETSSLRTKEVASAGFMEAALKSMDAEALDKAADNHAALLYGDIWNNPKLANEVGLREKLIGQSLEKALASNNLVLYDKLRNQQYDFADGTKGSLFSKLPMQEQVKLANSRREAWERTKVLGNAPLFEQWGMLEAQMKDGSFNMSYEQYQTFGMKLAEAGAFKTPNSFKEYIQAYWDYSAKNNDIVAKAQAFANNDSAEYHRLDVTPHQSAAAWDTLHKNTPFPQYLDATYKVAERTGNPIAYQKIGEAVEAASNALLSPDGKLHPTHAATLAQINHMIDTAKDPNAYVQILSGMKSDTSRDRLVMIRDLMGGPAKMSAEAAIQEVIGIEKRESALTPAQRNTLTEYRDKANRTFLDGLDPQGALSALGLGIRGIISTDAANEGTVRINASTMTNEDILARAGMRAKVEIANELSILSRSYKELSNESMHSKALANVAARTIPTDLGPVFLPRGTSVSQFFKVAPNVGTSTVGMALNDVLKDMAPPDSNVLFTLDGDKLRYTAFSKEGVQISNSIIDPSAVGAAIKKRDEKTRAMMNLASGEGVKFKTPAGDFQYNGTNTVGVKDDLMLQFRRNLVANEGFKDTPYKDASGKKDEAGNPILTVGVGVSSHNPAYPKGYKEGDKIPLPVLRESFLKASDEAANTGFTLQQRMNLNDRGFMLMSELAYQSGVNFTSLSSYRPFMQAVARKDFSAAESALKDTPAYKMAHTDRKRLYATLLKQTLGG